MRKRAIMLALIAMLSATSLFALAISEDTTAEQQQANAKVTQKAIASTGSTASAVVPIPQVKYFTERQTIANWYERWDKPSVVTYVYLISYGNILGYYVCNGKPASIQSYLVPEYHYEDGHDLGGGHYGEVQVQTQDLDGTYGTLNQGIRFFTAEGTAVEWGGSGATYLYSDAPLPLNVPKLNIEGIK